MRPKNDERKMEVYRFVSESIKERGVCPTTNEIGERLGMAKSTVSKYMNRLIDEGLIEKYGREKLCFILPLQRYNQGGVSDEFPEKPDPHPLRDYISAEVAIIEKYGVDYLDLSGDFPEPDTNAPTELFSDGLHPSDKGHKILADRVCEYVMSRK